MSTLSYVRNTFEAIFCYLDLATKS